MYTGGSLQNGTIGTIFHSSDGALGSYQCPAYFFDSGSVTVPGCATDLYSRRRYLTSSGLRELVAIATTYSQALICLTTTETSVTWDVDSTNFPTYNKDHPLNDDYSFNDEAFQALESKLINGGVTISTFTYDFSSISDEIALAFNDYTDTDKLYVVALNRASCSSTVMPLNDATLSSVGISSGNFLSLKPMEDWLIVFPLLFLGVAVAFGYLLKLLEIRIYKIQLKKAIESQQKEFIREDGSVDRIQYLKDLYNVIKHYLGEMSDQDPVQAIVDNENNEVDNRQQSEVMRDLEVLLREFFDDLRFNDGELVEEKAQAESTDESDNEGPHGEGDNEAEGEQEFRSGLGSGQGESQEQDPLDLDQLLLGNENDKIEEAEDEEDINDEGINAEIALNLDKDNERDRREFLEGLNRLGISEEDKRILLERYEDSLRRARDMMKGDAASQEKYRLAKLEERKNRKKEGIIKLKEMDDKEKEINDKYKNRILEIENAIESRIGNINDELVKEEEAQRRAIDEKFKLRLKKFKDNFYSKIKGMSGNNQKKLIADHEKENERLLNDLERERAYQEKKMIKDRDARRNKKIEETTKDLQDIKNDILREEADELEDVERQRLMIEAEYGFEDEKYGARPTSKEEREREAKRKANHIKEIELLRLKQRQNFEKKLIEDIVPEDEEMENLENNIDKQREDFKNKIKNASTESEKQRLLKELEGEKEQEWAEELERQRQQQEQARFERQKRRLLYKERNNFKLNSKHRDENLTKELELMAFDAYKRQEEALEKIEKLMDSERGSKDLPLKVYKMLEDMTSQRIDDQTKMNFYEISGRLSNLYTDIAFERALAKKNLEEDMNDKVKELDSKNISNDEFQEQVTAYQKELEQKGKEQERDLTRRQLESEMDIRGRLTEEHSTAKKQLEEELHQKKREVLEKLGKDFRNEGILKLLMDRSREDLENRLLKIAEEREEQQYKNELELVARTNKDLERMEKQLEADLAKEKEAMKNEMRKRRNKILKDLKQKYANELQNIDSLNKDQQDVLLKKKYEEEMSRFEAALAKESKEQQFRRLREKLILKKLEAEKDKELKRREARINKQMREAEEDKDDGKRKRGKAAKGKPANLLRQLTDEMTERIEEEYGAQKKLKKQQNINVMLKNFKDRVLERQTDKDQDKEKEKGKKLSKKKQIQRKSTIIDGKLDIQDADIPKQSKVFDEICNLYMRYKDDDYEEFDDASTFNKYKGDEVTDRLLRRIIRVEKISSALSESKVQQVINDLNQLAAILSKRK